MSTFKFAGTGSLKRFLEDVRAVIVTTKDTTVAAPKTIAGWETVLCPATTAAILGTWLDMASGIEVKTPAPEMFTANTGYKFKTKDFAPEFQGFGFMSYDDYRTWFAADGKEFDFWPVLSDGTILHCLTSAGVAKGFNGRIILTYDLPKPGADGKGKAHAFDIFFDDVQEYINYVPTTPDFKFNELKALSPIGVKLEVITNYTGGAGVGAVIVKATNRANGAPYLGFTAYTQFEVVSLSGDTGGAATAITAGAAGLATVTFLNTAANMTNDFEIQAVTITDSHVKYISNVLNIPV
jgi:hypothetical protein